MNIAALLPTLYRPDGLRRALHSLRDTAPDILPVVAREADDCEAMQIAEEFDAVHVVSAPPRAGCAAAWNMALRAVPDREAYVLASDDCEFLPGWYKETLRLLGNMGGMGLVGIRSKEGGIYTLSAFYLMTREFIAWHHGGVAAVPHYTMWFVDAEACARAQIAGCYDKTKKVYVKHHHAAPTDGARLEENKAIYKQRREAGFPDDFEPVIRK